MPLLLCFNSLSHCMDCMVDVGLCTKMRVKWVLDVTFVTDIITLRNILTLNITICSDELKITMEVAQETNLILRTSGGIISIPKDFFRSIHGE